MAYTPMGGSAIINVLVYTPIDVLPTYKNKYYTIGGSCTVKQPYSFWKKNLSWKYIKNKTNNWIAYYKYTLDKHLLNNHNNQKILWWW